jgi:hypothetical protein
MLTKEEREKLKADREAAVSAAIDLFDNGDIEGARLVLFNLGVSGDGIAEYLATWAAP